MPKYIQTIAMNWCQHDDNPRHLVYIKSIKVFAMYQQESGYYKILEDEHFEEMIWSWLVKSQKIDKNITPSTVKEIRKTCAWAVIRKVDTISSDYVALKDSLMEIQTQEFCEFSHKKMTFHYLPFEKSAVEDARDKELVETCPMFMKFLDDTIIDPVTKEPDKQTQKVIQEMFGYYLLGPLEIEAAFFLVGSGRNGKSVLLNVLKSLFPKEFISSVSIEQLTTDKWALASLVGKRMNICSEEESKYLRADKFKAIVSHESVEARRLYGMPFTMIPKVKFVFASNEIPSFKSLNKGLLRRLYLVPFYRTITDAEEKRGYAKILIDAELPGIFAWALAGARRLQDKSLCFSKSVQMDEEKIRFQKNMSSAILFINENYKEDENSFVSNQHLYEHYKAWCDDTGRKSMNKSNFSKDISRFLSLDSIRSYETIDTTEKKRLRGRQLKRTYEG